MWDVGCVQPPTDVVNQFCKQQWPIFPHKCNILNDQSWNIWVRLVSCSEKFGTLSPQSSPALHWELNAAGSACCCWLHLFQMGRLGSAPLPNGRGWGSAPLPYLLHLQLSTSCTPNVPGHLHQPCTSCTSSVPRLTCQHTCCTTCRMELGTENNNYKQTQNTEIEPT